MKELLDSPVPHKVRARGDGRALLDYLLDTFSAVEPRELRAAVVAGRFRLLEGDLPLDADSVLRAGDTILGDVANRHPEDPFAPPLPEHLDELHRDEHLLVIDKPPGLLCYPLGPRKIAAQSMARVQLEREGEPGELRPLHRIDRETSGVLMFARDLEADRAVKAMFQQRLVAKSYLAIARGHLAAARVVDAPIGDHEDHPIRMKMHVNEGGQAAKTRFRPIGWFGEQDFGAAGRGWTWLDAQPITGRTHQIRVHAAHIGHPLVGDKIYCEDGAPFLAWWDGALDHATVNRLGMRRQALHAWAIVLRHPARPDEVLRLRAPIPADMVDFARRHGGGPPAEAPLPDLPG